MGELLQRILKGVDLSSPHASAQIFHNMLAMVPWVPLLWFTLFSAVLGLAVGWWRGRPWLGLWISIVIGPIALLILMALPSRRGKGGTDDGGSPDAR
jgi:predicted small integral membrane protein